MNKTNSLDLLITGRRQPKATLALAHGAGAAMDSDFMNQFSDGLAKHKIKVVRFEFPYMSQRRETGKSKPPDREPVLRETWHNVIAKLGPGGLFIGGKSMGGRIASLIADESGVHGLVCLGYPFHPTGRPEKLRVEHLKNLKTKSLIVQGERDAFGNQEEVATYTLSRKIRLHWLTDGDHSFKPRKASGISYEENLQAGIDAVAKFVLKNSDA